MGDKIVDDLISKMTDRAFNASAVTHADLEEALRHVDLDNSVLGKPGQLASRASPLSASRFAAPQAMATSSRLTSLNKPLRVLPMAHGVPQQQQEADMEQLKQQLKVVMKGMSKADPALAALL